LFFKTQHVADIAYVLNSLLSTCQKQRLNSFKYLTELRKYSEKVRLNPEKWLPWNYKDEIKTIETERAK